MVISANQRHHRLSANLTRSTAPRDLPFAPARPARGAALGVLLSLCLSGAALGKDDGDDEEDAAKAKPPLPNFYLDIRTIYSTVPAGSLSIGFSTPPLLSTLTNLSSLRTLTSPSKACRSTCP
jgi:hypothetical protein